MSLSRRAFFHALGRGGTEAFSDVFVAARGLEALEAEAIPAYGETLLPAPPEPGEIRINSNENPLGPGKAVVDALLAELDQAGRYPFNSHVTDSDLMKTIAEEADMKPENVVLGAGSSEILRNAVRTVASPERPLVTADPSFESAPRMAGTIGTPVKAIPVDNALRLDLEKMIAASKGAGLVFFCN